jgi:hypothetical protein
MMQEPNSILKVLSNDLKASQALELAVYGPDILSTQNFAARFLMPQN